MKIVKFRDGQYGIRKGFFSYKYRDLVDTRWWWGLDSRHMKDCMGTLEKCRALLHDPQDVGTPI